MPHNTEKTDDCMTIEQAARELLAVLERVGDWDDGCFYYHGNTASELEKPMQDLADALEQSK